MNIPCNPNFYIRVKISLETYVHPSIHGGTIGKDGKDQPRSTLPCPPKIVFRLNVYRHGQVVAKSQLDQEIHNVWICLVTVCEEANF